MNMIPVNSNTINSIGYNLQTNTLYVSFDNGTYRYNNVPQQEYINLMNASSKGEYHKENIKWKYKYSKV